MSDLTNAAEAIADEAEPAPPTQEEAKALAESGEAEGTTPKEVAQVLKTSGINLPVDDEEGDDPDAEPAKADEPADDEEPEEPDEEQPEDKKPVAQPDKKEDVGPPELGTDDKYSFEIEDSNGVTFKITAEADIEDILAEFEPKNNGQIIKILDQLREVKAQKASDDAQAADDTAKAEQTKRATEIHEGWEAEAKVLQGSKRIPEGDAGTTRKNEVYKYMASENKTRMEQNRPTLNSFEDALDKLENKEARDKAVADAKADKETARSNGGKVGGSSAPASSAPPVYQRGSAKNPNQALRNMGLLERN